MSRPKILVTPAIDGRNTMVGLDMKAADAEGVRDKMEGETLAYAHAVADVMRKVRQSDGTYIEVVVPDFTVGGLEDLAKVEAFAADQGNVFANVAASPCWDYPDEVADYVNFKVNALVGKPGLTRPGMVWEAAADSGYVERGIPVFKIAVQDLQAADDNSIPEDMAAQLRDFALCATSIGSFKGRNYVSTGTSMGIPGSQDQRHTLLKYLGMGQEHVDMAQILGRINFGIYYKDELKKATEFWDDRCRKGQDDNDAKLRWTPEQIRAQDIQSLTATMIMRDLMAGNPNLPDEFSEFAKGYNACCAGFANQRHWSDFNAAGIIDTLLPSTYDWNGFREPFSVATENDVPQALMMRLGTLITGGAATLFHDNRSPWSPASVKAITGLELPATYTAPNGLVIDTSTGVIDARNSGDAATDGTGRQRDADGFPTLKPWYDISEAEMEECLANSKFCSVIREYFNGGGRSIQYQTEGGIPFTGVRLYYAFGEPRVQVIEGWSVDLGDICKSIAKETNETWPGTTFVPKIDQGGKYGEQFVSMLSVWHNLRSNHMVLIPGHVGHNVVTSMSMAGIPVPMHNVEPERILRPTLWAANGPQSSAATDLYVCNRLMPMYARHN